MNKIFNFRNLAGLFVAGSIVALSSCTKEEYVTTGAASASDVVSGQKVALTQEQSRTAQEMYARMPKLRYWDQNRQVFYEMKPGNRDFVFVDPDDNFSFDDSDGNGAVVYSDSDGDYLVISAGFGVAGQGGGGTVVAGNSALNIDITVCLSAEEVAAGDGYADLFDSGFGFDEFAAVFGISGDFEGLANADTGADDFNPFDYFHGFAAYYVLSDDVSGNHEVFDWLEADGTEDFDDFASSYVMDFQDFSLYFANGGNLNVSGGQMTFNGTYIAIYDLFESFLEEGVGEDELDVEEVSGFGTMGCN